jgi:hypothetical protein
LVHRGFVDLGHPDSSEEEDGEPPEANAASTCKLRNYSKWFGSHVQGEELDHADRLDAR